ncbi:MAG TPA: hypothetical protein VG738_00615 [Chitinophagaceae bacterium]|nr:hypothetical protein [Chitinophagaceae bacterium]
MDSSPFKNTVDIIESLVKSAGVIIGAVWVYLKFIRTRENFPKIEFNVDLRVVGRQDEKIIIEVIANLENKGLVRHWINDFTCDVLILRKEAPVIHGDERINYQLLFEKYNPVKDEKNETHTEKIVWIPKDWYDSFVDAGIQQQYTYLTAVPCDTAFISIYSGFHYRGDDFQTSQKTFSVAALENNGGKKEGH